MISEALWTLYIWSRQYVPDAASACPMAFWLRASHFVSHVKH